MSETVGELIRQMTADEIDFSDIPQATPAQMAKAVPLGQLFPELVRSQFVVALDDDVAEWVMQTSDSVDYENIINQIVREHIAQQESLEDTLRRVIREELQSVAA